MDKHGVLSQLPHAQTSIPGPMAGTWMDIDTTHGFSLPQKPSPSLLAIGKGSFLNICRRKEWARDNSGGLDDIWLVRDIPMPESLREAARTLSL